MSSGDTHYPRDSIGVLEVGNLPEVEMVDSVGLWWWTGSEGPMVVYSGDSSDYLLGCSEWENLGWILALREPAHPRMLGAISKWVGEDLIIRQVGRDRRGRPVAWIYTGASSDGCYTAVYGFKKTWNDSVCFWYLKGYYMTSPRDLHWDERRIYVVPLPDALDPPQMDLYILHFLGDSLPKLDTLPASARKPFFSTFPRNGKLELRMPSRGNWELSLYSAIGALAFKEKFPNIGGWLR